MAGKIRSELLRVWKKQYGMRATYKALLKACVSTHNHDAADIKIIKLLGGM